MNVRCKACGKKLGEHVVSCKTGEHMICNSCKNKGSSCCTKRHGAGFSINPTQSSNWCWNR